MILLARVADEAVHHRLLPKRRLVSLLLLAASLWTFFSGPRPALAEANELPRDLSNVALSQPAAPEPPLRGRVQQTERLPVELSAVITLVGNRSLDLQRVNLRKDLARTYTQQEIVGLLPNVGASASQSRFQGSFVTADGRRVGYENQSVSPQLNANWTLHPGGRAIYEALAAKRRQNAVQVLVEETWQEQLAAITDDYYRWLDARLNLAAIRKTLAEAQENLNEALEVSTSPESAAQHQAGEAPIATTQQAPSRAQINRLRSQVRQQLRAASIAETYLGKCEQSLLTRLNLAPELALDPVDETQPVRPLVSLDIPAETWIKKALSQHPTLRRLETELSALRADAGAVRSDLLPSVTLSASVRSAGRNADSLSDRAQSGSVSVQTNLLEGMGLAVPLRMKAKRKEIDIKTLDLKATARDIAARINNAYLDAVDARDGLEFATEELHAEREARRQDEASAARPASDTGNAAEAPKPISLSEAESSEQRPAPPPQTLAEIRYQQAVLQYNRAQVQLLRTLGMVSPPALLHGVPVPPALKIAPDNKPLTPPSSAAHPLLERLS
jgi:outer membrane protein TolC